MKKRTNSSDIETMIAKGLVWVAGKALESAPVIGPIVRVINFVNDVAEIRKSSA